MKTEFFARAGMSDVRLVSGWPIKSMTPEDVASVGYDALMSGRPMLVPSWRNRFLALAADLAPRPLKVRFARWIMDRVGAR